MVVDEETHFEKRSVFQHFRVGCSFHNLSEKFAVFEQAFSPLTSSVFGDTPMPRLCCTHERQEASTYRPSYPKKGPRSDPAEARTKGRCVNAYEERRLAYMSTSNV